MKKKVMMKNTKKLLLILLIISIFTTGCIPINSNDSNKTETKEFKFTGLDDKKLHNYVIDNLNSTMNAEFTNDNYEINDITTVYVSKEYIEEVDFNSKSNIYFGYTLNELSSKFKDKKYVFEVDSNNKTSVVEFEDYEETYNRILKNVITGSGVILICTTVSLSTGGTLAIVMATSAKTATSFALSSATLSGMLSSAVEYYNTGNIQESLKTGAIEASEGFKWGAIIGAVAGGVNETLIQSNGAKEILQMDFRERGIRSEIRAKKIYGGREQVSYLNGVEVPNSVTNATRPDLIRNVNGKLEAIEVKNYNLNKKNCRKNLIKELKRQVSNRVENLPKDSSQRIVLDIQGRNYSKKILNGVIKGIKESCKDVYPNLPVDVIS